MKSVLLCILFLSNSIISNGQSTLVEKTAEGWTISNVMLINVESGLEKRVSIEVENQHIGKVIAGNPSSSNDPQLLYAIPGLWDMHVHITDAKKVILPVLVAHGITTVRDMGGDLNYLNEIVGDTNSITPTIFRSGPYLDGNKPGLPYRITLSDSRSAIKAVDSLIDRGVHFIKIHNQVPRESYFTLAEYCEKKGLALAGHIPVEISPYEAVLSKQRSLEHATTLFEGTFTTGYRTQLEMFQGVQEFVESGYDSLATMMVKHGTFFTPNLIATHVRANKVDLNENPGEGYRYIPASMLSQWDSYFPVSEKDKDPNVIKFRKLFSKLMMELTYKMQQKGVKILAASDLALRDIYPGSSLHDELTLMVEAGFTPKEALRTATIEPPKFFGLEDQYGEVSVGKRANLVLLRGNPLDDIENIRQIEAVVVNGQLITKDEIAKLLVESEKMSKDY